jgi:hypothetical protein
MATWDNVREIALRLPETSEQTSHGNVAWSVKDKAFIWERPLRRGDREALGDRAPSGPILAARVDHEGIKVVLIASNADVFFTTPHFNGYPAILIRLDEISVADLRDVIVEAWLARAPKRLAKEYLASQPS